MKQNLLLAFTFTCGIFCFSCHDKNESNQENTGTKDSVAVNTPDSAKAAAADCKALAANARHIDSLILGASAMNKALAEQAINAFGAYASNCNDSMAPVFLLKAGQVAQSVMNIEKAKSFFNTCITDFPQYKNRGAAMFLLARLYDEPRMLNNEAEAKKLYEQIVKEYPKTVWAQDAKAAIQNLGKSDEDLIKEFMKKNGVSKENS